MTTTRVIAYATAQGVRSCSCGARLCSRNTSGFCRSCNARRALQYRITQGGGPYRGITSDERERIQSLLGSTPIAEIKRITGRSYITLARLATALEAA